MLTLAHNIAHIIQSPSKEVTQNHAMLRTENGPKCAISPVMLNVDNSLDVPPHGPIPLFLWKQIAQVCPPLLTYRGHSSIA